MTALRDAMIDAQRQVNEKAAALQVSKPATERERLWLVLQKHPKGLTIKELVTNFKFAEGAVRSAMNTMEAAGTMAVRPEKTEIGGKVFWIKRLFALGDAYVKSSQRAGRPAKAFATGAVSVPASARPGPSLPDVGNMTVAQLQQMAENGRKAQAILADAAKLYEALGKILNG